MKVYKAKSSSYNTVRSECILRYIQEYSEAINKAVNSEDAKQLSRTDLKRVAADLESVKKRLDAHLA